MDTGLYRDIVYTEYMLEHDLTWQEMMEKTHTDEMLKRVAHMEWQDTQRTAWMAGETPEYTCLLYTSPSPRDATLSRMPSSA